MIAPLGFSPTPAAALIALRGFIGPGQLAAVRQLLRGEEGAWYQSKICALAATVLVMPETYGQDGKGSAAVVFLHYFTGGCDFYLTEKDRGDPDDAPEDFQSQAFGLANLGQGGELGYISLPEILSCGAELDFHWEPKTLEEIGA